MFTKNLLKYSIIFLVCSLPNPQLRLVGYTLN